MNLPAHARLYPASRRSFYFTLHLYPTLKSLRHAWHLADRPYSGRRVVAFCTRYYNEKGVGKCIGEIHILHTACPSVIAHECTHAGIHYLRVSKLKGPPITDDEEPLCYAVQHMVRQVLDSLAYRH